MISSALLYGFHADFRFGPIIAVGLACLRRVYGMPTCEWSAAGGGGYGFRKILGQQNTLLRERGSEAISFSPFPRVLWCTSVYVAQKTIPGRSYIYFVDFCAQNADLLWLLPTSSVGGGALSLSLSCTTGTLAIHTNEMCKKTCQCQRGSPLFWWIRIGLCTTPCSPCPR